MLAQSIRLVTLTASLFLGTAALANEGRQVLWCANRAHQTLEVREIQAEGAAARTLVRFADAESTHEQTVTALINELVEDENTASLQLNVLDGDAAFSISAQWSPAGSSAVIDLQFSDGFQTGTISDMSCVR